MLVLHDGHWVITIARKEHFVLGWANKQSKGCPSGIKPSFKAIVSIAWRTLSDHNSSQRALYAGDLANKAKVVVVV